MRLRTLAVAGTALIALAGCNGGGGNSGSQPTTATSGHNSQQETLRQATQCMRANGHPDWPDPVQNANGDWVFPDNAPDVDTPPACQALMRAGKAGNAPTKPALTAAEIAQARKWSECMRQHGLADWPDPDSDGVINPPANLQPVDTNSQVLEATSACRSVEPAGGPRLKPQQAPEGNSAKPGN